MQSAEKRPGGPEMSERLVTTAGKEGEPQARIMRAWGSPQGRCSRSIRAASRAAAEEARSPAARAQRACRPSMATRMNWTRIRSERVRVGQCARSSRSAETPSPQ